MALAEDLINFDIIEAHKENVAQLPGGRSARQLAAVLSPYPSSRNNTDPTLDETKTLNDAIRREYETELLSVADSDDPLDIYDRYVKWTLNAYPSAQATPQSQLLPLLERATKAFLTSSHYKNDPRYLKLWLTYIRLFSDAPRETFAFLARHNVGEGLGLFYEEFAAWLEGAGRWPQADEVYRLGVEREARPAERLLRKYTQFQQRFAARPENAHEPSSPALPTVRPALAAKIDPFASSSTPRSDNPQARPESNVLGASSSNATARSVKPKMTIFSDTDNVTPPATADGAAATTAGWSSIGSLKDRKKENTIEARPWAGETIKGGKKLNGGPKMEIFRDPNSLQNDEESRPSQPEPKHSNVTKSKSGPRSERAFVKLDAVYPNEREEFCFEELRAVQRGWLQRRWKEKQDEKAARPEQSPLRAISTNLQRSPDKSSEKMNIAESDSIEKITQDLKNVTAKGCRNGSALDSRRAPTKPRRTKIREIKQETQTIKTRLESPTSSKTKLKRRMSGPGAAEPTMTFHSKAATDEIYNIFNQPRDNQKDDNQDVDEEDFLDDDDGFSTAGESTGTGRISRGSSEYGGDDDTLGSSVVNTHAAESESENTSVSPWSEFTASKHLPGAKLSKTKLRQTARHDDPTSDNLSSSQNQTQTGSGFGMDTQAIAAIAEQDFGDLDTRVIAAMAGDLDEDESTQEQDQATRTSDLPPKTPVDEQTSPFQSSPFTKQLSTQNSPQKSEADDDDVEVLEHKTRYIPLPPVDYDPTPLLARRDPEQIAQSRLPFMTPIAERTESSLGGPMTAKTDFGKTPSRMVAATSMSGAKTDSPSKLRVAEMMVSSPVRVSPGSAKRKSLHTKLQSPIIDLTLEDGVMVVLKNGGEDNNGSPKKKAATDQMVRHSPVKKSTTPSQSPAKILFPFRNATASSSPEKVPANIITLDDDLDVFRKPAIPQRPVTSSITHKQPSTFPTTTSKPTGSYSTKSPLIKDLQLNPTDPSIRAQILTASHSPLSREPDFFNHPTEKFARQPQLAAYTKQLATSTNRSTKPPSFSPRRSHDKTQTKPQPLLVFQGAHRVYAVKRLLGAGAFAPVYLVDSADADETAAAAAAPRPTSALDTQPRGALEAIKTDTPAQNGAWEFYLLRTLKRRLGGASRAMASIVLAREVHVFADEAYLVLDFHAQGTLLDLVNLFRGEAGRAGRTVEGLDEGLAVWFAVELLRVVEACHSVGVLHGDLKADNCLVRFGVAEQEEVTGPYCPEGKQGWAAKGLTLIDFGRGIDTRAFEAKARFMADWASGQTDCVEIREARTWRAEIDWFGVAGVCATMLFGRYIETVPVPVHVAAGEEVGLGLGMKKEWKLKESFRRYWQGEMWGELFHLLINSGVVSARTGGGEEGVRREVRRVREGMEAWLVAEGEREGRNLRKSVRRAEELVRMR